MTTEKKRIQFEEPFPFCQRDKDLKWNGWGWNDSYFYINDKYKAFFTGTRYDMSNKYFSKMPFYMEKIVNAGLDHTIFAEIEMNPEKIPTPIINETFLQWLKDRKIIYSIDGMKRINRSHGHTIEEIAKLRIGECEARIPDIVVFPENHNEVKEIVMTANRLNVVIIPIGGGTNVTNALTCPVNETRCIVSLDVCRMNRILWVDKQNLTARVECGILGLDLENQLNEKGFTFGHEPDSIEFSSLGGWVSTRASGIKKNKYGNIEDLIVNVSVVTPSGVIEKSCSVPRMSSGPDIHHFILGSEGTLGVITEVTIKIFETPKCKRFGCILFPNFESGVNMLREVAKQKIAPSSIRLMDNIQYQFGQSIKPDPSIAGYFLDIFKMFYVYTLRGFHPDHICPATLFFEGSKEEVDLQQKRINKLSKKFGGMVVGSGHGQHGYNLTFAIAYIRDIAMNYYGLGESFETSAPWDKVTTICKRVIEVCTSEAIRLGVINPTFINCRVTQVYDTGACIYFYFGFNYREIDDEENNERTPVQKVLKGLEIYEKIETAARNEIIALGGSISHHHGVGKIRKRWLPQTVGEVGMGALQAVKAKLDPNNIFASGNLFTSTTSKL